MRAAIDRPSEAKPRGSGERRVQERDSNSFARMGLLPGPEPRDFVGDFGANEAPAGEGVQGVVWREDQRRLPELLAGQLSVGNAVADLPQAAVLVGSISCSSG